MKETATSNIHKANKLVRIKPDTPNLSTLPCLPKRVINKCPATIFAASRTERVRGRIKDLTTSISTIKGIKAPGVPRGTRCDNISLVVCTQP